MDWRRMAETGGALIEAARRDESLLVFDPRTGVARVVKTVWEDRAAGHGLTLEEENGRRYQCPLWPYTHWAPISRPT